MFDELPYTKEEWDTPDEQEECDAEYAAEFDESLWNPMNPLSHFSPMHSMNPFDLIF
jgi:hypothetical protein